jgi:peptidoglycan/xylan/chitin deacetylase (PgdA/CDA1 family)
MRNAGRRRLVLWAAGAATLLALCSWSVFEISRARCFALVGDILCRVETDRPMVALTFDDGPTEQGVAAALQALEDRGASATFFLIGEQVAQRPHLVRRIVAAGHEIANHSFSHQRMVARPASFYDMEIRLTHDALISAGAPKPALFRPPYGKKLWGLPAAVRRHGYEMVMIDVEEPETEDPRAYAERLVREARSGSILLMHLMYGGNEAAREALPLVIEGLQARGFEVVSVGELLRRGGAAAGQRTPAAGLLVEPPRRALSSS